MAILLVETKKVRTVWMRKNIELYEAQLVLPNGDRKYLKTYAKAIATPGFIGKIETYDRNGETFVRFPKRTGDDNALT